jgi:hypothetical protein
MRQMISGLVAAIALVAAGAAPAMACGETPCGQAYIPAPVYSGCDTGCGGWAYERLPDPVQQYYYVNQGPTYTGPGNFAPEPTYQEGGYYHRPHYGFGYRHHFGYHHYRPWHHAGYGYGARYGYHHSYAPRYYAPRHMRYGYAPHHYGYGGYREHVLRRYY